MVASQDADSAPLPVAELRESSADAQSKYQAEKQSQKQLEGKASALEEALADLRVEKENLEKVSAGSPEGASNFEKANVPDLLQRTTFELQSWKRDPMGHLAQPHSRNPSGGTELPISGFAARVLSRGALQQAIFSPA